MHNRTNIFKFSLEHRTGIRIDVPYLSTDGPGYWNRISYSDFVHARVKFCVYLYYFPVLYLCIALRHMMQYPVACIVSRGRA